MQQHIAAVVDDMKQRPASSSFTEHKLQYRRNLYCTVVNRSDVPISVDCFILSTTASSALSSRGGKPQHVELRNLSCSIDSRISFLIPRHNHIRHKHHVGSNDSCNTTPAQQVFILVADHIKHEVKGPQWYEHQQHTVSNQLQSDDPVFPAEETAMEIMTNTATSQVEKTFTMVMNDSFYLHFVGARDLLHRRRSLKLTVT